MARSCVPVSARYCIPQCVRLIAGGGGGGLGVRMGSGVHGSYTFPVQTDGVFYFPWHRPDSRDQRLLVSLPKDTGKVG